MACSAWTHVWYKNVRLYQSSCTSGVRWWALITLQSKIGNKSMSWKNRCSWTSSVLGEGNQNTPKLNVVKFVYKLVNKVRFFWNCVMMPNFISFLLLTVLYNFHIKYDFIFWLWLLYAKQMDCFENIGNDSRGIFSICAECLTVFCLTSSVATVTWAKPEMVTRTTTVAVMAEAAATVARNDSASMSRRLDHRM